MKTRTWFLVVIALVAPWVARARVGETEQELTGRFGEPSNRGVDQMLAQGKMWTIGPQLIFQEDDWHITSVLVEGRVAKESYAKSGDWTENHIATVLTANAQGAKWTETSPEGTRKLLRNWRRADGATALWTLSSGMIVTVPAYERAKKIIEAKAKAEASQPAKI